MPTGKSTQAGFTYLFVLMLIALIGMGLAAAGTLWHTEAQREREAELLFIGAQYRQAIRSYYERDDVAPPRLPQSVEELLEDSRTAKVVRHLRRAYRDPLTGGEFALIQEPDTQGIIGVHSQAKGQPIKIAGFQSDDALLAGASSYAEWRFVFTPPVVQAATPGASRSSPLQSKSAPPPPSTSR